MKTITIDSLKTWKIIVPAILIIGVAFALVLPTYAATSDLYVNQADGSCVTGSGQPDPHTVVYCTIQDAIDDALDGETIGVAPGIYDEPLNIDTRADLTINGSGGSSTVLKSSTTLAWDVGGYGSSRQAVVRVVNSSNIQMFHMVFDFDLVKGNNVFGIFFWDSSGFLSANTFQNMGVPGDTYYEITSYFRGPGGSHGSRYDIDLTSNTFIDTGRLGVLAHDYVDVYLNNNTFYKTFDDFGYAVEVGSKATGEVYSNTIYGFDKAADSDGSTSAGIYIENAFTNDVADGTGFTKPVTIQSNEIYDCQYGVYIGNEFDGFAGDVDIVVDLVNNNIHDNLLGGVVIADEDKEAGSSVSVTASNNTLDNNGDYGYFVYTNGDGDITATLSSESISGHSNGFYVNDTLPLLGDSSYDFDISGSTFSDNPVQVYRDEPLTNTELNIPATYAGNTFDQAVYASSGQGIYSSIQAAIDSANVGDTVLVAPGTYVENLSIATQNLTVTSSGTAAETILDGTVEITADGVTFDALTVSPSTTFTSIPSAAILVIDASHVNLTNNIITGLSGDGSVTIHGIQIFGESSPYITDFTIANNTIIGIDNGGGPTWPDYHGAVGIKIQNWVDGVDILENVISDIHSAGWTYGIVTTPSTVDPATPTDILIQDNEVDLINDGSVYDVWADPSSAPYPGVGFAIDTGASAAEAVLHYNSFINVPYGAVNKDTGVSLSAELNWWGHATGPSHASNPHGEGQGGVGVSDDVAFIPWYATETTSQTSEAMAVHTGGASLIALSDQVQGALDAALAGYVINVGDGIFEEDLVIGEHLTGLELAGTGIGLTTLKGVAQVDAVDWPLAVPNIEVLADGVIIHDFTIQGPDPLAGYYSSGMVIGGNDLEVYNNAFEVPNAASLDDISQGVQTYLGANNPTAGGVGGLYVHNNTFIDFGAGSWGYEGIYINSDVGDPIPTGLVEISDNTFGGDIVRALTTERSKVSIMNNTIANDLAPSDLSVPGGWQGINVRSSVEQRDIKVSDNVVGGLGAGLGFLEGIRIGQDEDQVMYSIIVTGNTYPGDNTTDLVRYDEANTIGLYDPATSLFYLKPANEGGWDGVNIFKFGPPDGGRLTIVGDWDGNGTDTIGLYDPVTSLFYLKPVNEMGWDGVNIFKFGPPDDGRIPIAGDWDGDGTDTIGLYDPATSTFYLKPANQTGWDGVNIFDYGPPGGGRIPLVGDWDGDGTDTIGLYDPATSIFYLKPANETGSVGVNEFKYGPAGGGRIPILGDWDKDGTDTIGLFDPVTSLFYLKPANETGWDGVSIFKFGPPDGDRKPIVGDW